MRKGFVIPLIVAVVAVLAVGGGVFYYLNKPIKLDYYVHPVATNTPIVTPISSPVDKTTDWKIYTSTQYGFEIRHPADWIIISSSSGIILASPKTVQQIKDYPNLPTRYDISITIEPKTVEYLNTGKDILFNGIPAKQIIEEDEESSYLYIYIDNYNNTFKVRAALTDIEEKILSTFKFINPNPIACTMDAKMCPDGTYVGRSGPNCEFVCTNNQPSITLISPNGGEVLDGKSINKITWISSDLRSTDTVSIGFRPMSDLSKVCWLEGMDEPPIMVNQGSFEIIPGNIYCTRESSKWDYLSQYKIQLQVNQYTEGVGVADMSDNYFTIK